VARQLVLAVQPAQVVAPVVARQDVVKAGAAKVFDDGIAAFLAQGNVTQLKIALQGDRGIAIPSPSVSMSITAEPSERSRSLSSSSRLSGSIRSPSRSSAVARTTSRPAPSLMLRTHRRARWCRRPALRQTPRVRRCLWSCHPTKTRQPALACPSTPRCWQGSRPVRDRTVFPPVMRQMRRFFPAHPTAGWQDRKTPETGPCSTPSTRTRSNCPTAPRKHRFSLLRLPIARPSRRKRHSLHQSSTGLSDQTAHCMRC